MDHNNQTDAAAAGPVTGIIVHHPRIEAREAYENWLVEIREACRQFPGYLSTDVVRPACEEDGYTVIIRFAGVEQLKAWIESDVRREFLQRIEPALAKGDRYVIRTGLDFWFAQPASVTPPKRHKQFLLTLSAIFPLTIVVPWVLGPLLRLLEGPGGFVLGKLLVATAIVFLMVFAIMPHYTRLVAKWLYR
jgi:antibiotic biosynthesis monooxygenase (ABM) superfamily enzyme